MVSWAHCWGFWSDASHHRSSVFALVYVTNHNADKCDDDDDDAFWPASKEYLRSNNEKELVLTFLHIISLLWGKFPSSSVSCIRIVVSKDSQSQQSVKMSKDFQQSVIAMPQGGRTCHLCWLSYMHIPSPLFVFSCQILFLKSYYHAICVFLNFTKCTNCALSCFILLCLANLN